MQEGGPNNKRIEIDITKPGYTMLALGMAVGLRESEGFVPRVDIRDEIREQQLNPTKPADHTPGSLGLEEHRKEMAEHAGLFIDEIWSVIKEIQGSDGNKVLVEKNDEDEGPVVFLEPLEIPKFKERLAGLGESEKDKEIYKAIKLTISSAVETSLRVRREIYEEAHPLDPDYNTNEIMVQKLNRLEELIGFGDHNIREVFSNKPVDNISSYITGGFETTLSRAIGYTRLIMELYEKTFNRKITKEELAKLTKRPPLFSLLPNLSTPDAETITYFITETRAGSVMRFNPEKFVLMEKDRSLSLEIKPKDLEQILGCLGDSENHKHYMNYVGTGCPAHQTRSAKPVEGGVVFGERITLEAYDWINKIILDLVI